MISDKFLRGNIFLGGKLQIDTKKSNFEIFESALYMKSVSMPLNMNIHTCTDLNISTVDYTKLYVPVILMFWFDLEVHPNQVTITK